MRPPVQRPPSFHVEGTAFTGIDPATDRTAYLDCEALTRIIRGRDGLWRYFVERPGCRPSGRAKPTLEEAIEGVRLETTGTAGNVILFRPR